MRKIFLLFLMGAVSQVYGTTPYGEPKDAFYEHCKTYPAFGKVAEAKWEMYEKLHEDLNGKSLSKIIGDLGQKKLDQHPRTLPSRSKPKITEEHLQGLMRKLQQEGTKIDYRALTGILYVQLHAAHADLIQNVRNRPIVYYNQEERRWKPFPDTELPPKDAIEKSVIEGRYPGDPTHYTAALIDYAFVHHCISYGQMMAMEVDNQFGNAAKHIPSVEDWGIGSTCIVTKTPERGWDLGSLGISSPVTKRSTTCSICDPSKKREGEPGDRSGITAVAAATPTAPTAEALTHTEATASAGGAAGPPRPEAEGGRARGVELAVHPGSASTKLSWAQKVAIGPVAGASDSASRVEHTPARRSQVESQGRQGRGGRRPGGALSMMR